MGVTSVYTDLEEYSRYHLSLSTITTTIEVANPTSSAALSVALFRLDGYGAVSTKTIALTEATQYTVTFDLNQDGYVQSTDGNTISNPVIYMAKQGDYQIQVTDPDGNVTNSAMFAVSIVPIMELRNEWIKGVTLYDYEVLEPRIQPQLVTGVTVTEVSANHLLGPFTLQYTQGNPSTLSWGGGQAIPVNGQGTFSLLLMNSTQDFIMVQVNTFELPEANQDESLYIDNGRIKDRAIIDQMRRATAAIEQAIVTKIEPTIVDTDAFANNRYADETAIAETYIRPRNYNKWMSFQIPYFNVLDLSVVGYFNTSQTALVPRQWLVWDERSGICELVPSTSSQVIWTFYNSVFIMAYLFNTNSIPGFWHYRAVVGLRDLNGNRAIVREAIAKKTAIELLNSAGSAYRAGYASQSTSRDGVSQSEGYTSSSLAGTYGSHFNNYKEWLANELPKMRTRFCGMQFRSI